MNYAAIKKFDIANGPGVRVSLFVSGCRHKCKNCFNSEAWDFDYGEKFTEETLDELLEAVSLDYIEGFSLLGGEPFEPENQDGVLKILKMFSLEPETSKSAFAHFVDAFRNCGGQLIDSQVYTSNLARFGARNISRTAFLRLEKEFLTKNLTKNLQEEFIQVVNKSKTH